MTRVLALGYLLLVLSVTLLPIFGFDPHEPIVIYTTPFRTVRNALVEGPISDQFALVVGNIAMFVPLGALIPVLRQHTSALHVVGGAFLLSGAIELSQLAISLLLGHAYRTADVDDVILNVVGGLLGYVVYRTLLRRVGV